MKWNSLEQMLYVVSLLLILQEVMTGSPVPPSVQLRNSRPDSNINMHYERKSEEKNKYFEQVEQHQCACKQIYWSLLSMIDASLCHLHLRDEWVV